MAIFSGIAKETKQLTLKFPEYPSHLVAMEETFYSNGAVKFGKPFVIQPSRVEWTHNGQPQHPKCEIPAGLIALVEKEQNLIVKQAKIDYLIDIVGLSTHEAYQQYDAEKSGTKHLKKPKMLANKAFGTMIRVKTLPTKAPTTPEAPKTAAYIGPAVLGKIGKILQRRRAG